MKELTLLIVLLGAAFAYGKSPTISLDRAILAAERGQECAIFRRLESKTLQTISRYQEAVRLEQSAATLRRSALESCAHDFGIADWESEPGLVQVAEVCGAPLEGFILVNKRSTVSRQDIDAAREQLQYVRAKLRDFCRPLSNGARVSLK